MKKWMNWLLLLLAVAFIYWNGLEGNRRTLWLDKIQEISSEAGSQISTKIKILKAFAKETGQTGRQWVHDRWDQWRQPKENPPASAPALSLEQFKVQLQYAQDQHWADQLLRLQHHHPQTKTETIKKLTIKTLEFGDPVIKLILKIQGEPSKVAVEAQNFPFDAEVWYQGQAVFQFNGLLERVRAKPDEWHHIDEISAAPGPWEGLVKQELIRYNIK